MASPCLSLLISPSNSAARSANRPNRLTRSEIANQEFELKKKENADRVGTERLAIYGSAFATSIPTTLLIAGVVFYSNAVINMQSKFEISQGTRFDMFELSQGARFDKQDARFDKIERYIERTDSRLDALFQGSFKPLK
jgi:hypothetical protein